MNRIGTPGEIQTAIVWIGIFIFLGLLALDLLH